jgi:periplasmic glucans biosynthesis protein
VDRAILDRIDYDLYQQIKYRPDASLALSRSNTAPVQLFHLSKLFLEPVKIHLVDGGMEREVLYSPALFDTPTGHPAGDLSAQTGFAGFRVMAKDLKTDWMSFLGASYFRSTGPYNQYGLSARGLAIDTGLLRPEEFPRFTEFWLEGGQGSQPVITVYAMLDSPSVAGVYRFSTEHLTNASDIHRVVMDVEAHLYPRRTIGRVGIAPFSSMFWYGEGSRKRAADWRPEIHDSDGLAIHAGTGERIWRPINNPGRVMTSAFMDRDPKGFGLLQRDRDFVHYLDDGVFYERRPSVWVEPLDGWGEGAVHLVEIPTDDETMDNIVAYWCPKDVLAR